MSARFMFTSILSIIAERCNKTVKQVAKVTMHDRYFDTEEALEFGLITAVFWRFSHSHKG